ncbi:MAG TPA: SpoIIE family protein phosphatase [Tepidisphaeraceae bacterium]|nr:SpoIIE family protein phosphatase [Tepidisphaeraceae bacterium]
MSGRPIKVLLVEDNPGDALLLRETLADTNAAIEWSHDQKLSSALNRLEKERFDVVLLDLSLPDSHGIETFHKVRKRAPEAPVVMLTGLDDETTAVEAMSQGAQDYLVKGGTDGHALLRSMRYAIERTRREFAERELRAAHADLQAAREIQQRLFPAQAPALPGFDIAGASFPAGDTGGDYYDFIPMLQGRLGLVVGDVSGHGFGPALIMANTRAYLRALSLTCPGVGDILTRANAALREDTADEHFVTLLYAALNPRDRTLEYASAGHNPGYVLNRGEIRSELSSTEMPLGISSDLHFTTAEPIVLQVGDVLLLFTDGVVEARGPDKSDFGTERIVDVIRRECQRPAREIVDAIYRAAREFADDQPQKDDITVLLAKVL